MQIGKQRIESTAVGMALEIGGSQAEASACGRAMVVLAMRESAFVLYAGDYVGNDARGLYGIRPDTASGRRPGYNVLLYGGVRMQTVSALELVHRAVVYYDAGTWDDVLNGFWPLPKLTLDYGSERRAEAAGRLAVASQRSGVEPPLSDSVRFMGNRWPGLGRMLA
jgi:hypothetical protein